MKAYFKHIFFYDLDLNSRVLDLDRYSIKGLFRFDGALKLKFSTDVFINKRFFYNRFKLSFLENILLKQDIDIRKESYLRRLVGKKIFVNFFYPSVTNGQFTNFYFKRFVGKCIGFKRPNKNTSIITLRNSYNNQYPVEFSLFLYSPFLRVFRIFENRNPFFRLNSRKKLYYYRKFNKIKV